MRRMREAWVLVVVLGLAGSSVASAQTDAEQEARHHFRLGSAHYESGHFVEAAREFEESYRLSGRAALLHNVYVAYRDAGMTAEAADALGRYLAEDPNVENRPLLERRLAVLRRMAAAGQESSEESEAAAIGPAAATTETTATTTTTTSASTVDSAAATDAGGGGGLSPIGFIVGGVGAAALIAGAITGGLALSQQSELETNCPNDVCPPGYDYASAADSGRTLAIATDVLIPVGVAALAAGVVLILVLREGGDDSATAGAACGPDGCMGVVGGRF